MLVQTNSLCSKIRLLVNSAQSEVDWSQRQGFPMDNPQLLQQPYVESQIIKPSLPCIPNSIGTKYFKTHNSNLFGHKTKAATSLISTVMIYQ